MDMKKILQAMDSASTKPVEGANDMKKFLSVVTEGANPHKVSLPVQMAMQHYQKPAEKAKPRTRLIDKYFTEAEATIVQKKQEEKQLLKQYAQTIAERVLMKEAKKTENFNPNMSPNAGFKPTAGPGIMSSVAEDNTPDAITVDVPLMIRLMEYAREDAKDDLDLHDVAEQLVALSSEGKTLSMADYESIVSKQVNEAASFATTGGGAATGNPNITNKKQSAPVTPAAVTIEGEGLNANIVVDGVEIYGVKDFLFDLGFSAAIVALGTALAAPSGGSSEMVAAAAIANPIRRVFTYVVKYATHLAKSGTLSKEAISNYVKSRADAFTALLRDNLAPAALKATTIGTAMFNTVAGILEKHGLLPEWMKKEKPFDPENPETSVKLK